MIFNNTDLLRVFTGNNPDMPIVGFSLEDTAPYREDMASANKIKQSHAPELGHGALHGKTK